MAESGSAVVQRHASEEKETNERTGLWEGVLASPTDKRTTATSEPYIVERESSATSVEHGAHEEYEGLLHRERSLRGWADPKFRRKFFAASIGNILEWYDFAIFGYFAAEIGDQFFPSGDESRKLLDSFIVFGVAFVMRPVGGVLFGKIGDKYGRKRALEISIALMLIPSFIMGFLPTYDQVGYAAPALLILVRLCQGVATGGELVGAFIFLIEAAPTETRGFWGAICFAGANLGTALGAAVGAIIREFTKEKQVNTVWGDGDMLYVIGWRYAFWSSIILGAIGVYLRQSLEDSDEFEAVKHDKGDRHDSITTVFRKYGRQVILTIGHTCLWTTVFWLSFVWLASFQESLLEEESEVDQPFEISLGVQVLCCLCFPLAGVLADRVGQETIIMTGTVLIFASCLPVFILYTDGATSKYIVGQSMFAVFMAMIGGPLPVWMVNQFPVEVRYTGMGISYNLAQAIFGGSATPVATILAEKEVIPGYPGKPGLTPALYIMGVAVLAFIAECVSLRDTWRANVYAPLSGTTPAERNAEAKSYATYGTSRDTGSTAPQVHG
eukprot:m.705791 g.705791  ORF g.705791 m.705791 type:complete len:555 (-) comp22929_c0_seq1:510-2174(-)